MEYETGLNMARQMKKEDLRIRQAIKQTERNRHGVVALRFHDKATRMEIEILDEPFDPNVRIYPGE